MVIGPHESSVVAFRLISSDSGPFTIDIALWCAEPRVLRRIPFTIRGDTR